MRVVIGLGKTGLSCIQYFIKKKLPIIVMDTREDPPGLAELKADIPVYLGGLRQDLLEQASELIVSPGLSLREPALAAAIAQGVPAIGDIELFAREAKAPIVAITGSNAKGTVTTLVGEMARKAGLQVRVGGNIGTPALDLLSDQEPDLYVLEISSFQLETTYSLRAAAATILNISPDHLDRYANLEEYIAAKQRIYQGCQVAVYNKDDSKTKTKFEKTISFGSSSDADFCLIKKSNTYWLSQGDKPLLPVTALRIHGKHNYLNALAALALGTAVNLPMDAMLEALQEFPGLPYRCQWLCERQGVSWYNDSKGTNIGATIAAIEGLAGNIILIAGGIGKDADFTQLRNSVKKYVRQVILIGQDAKLIETALQGTTTISHATSLEEAVKLADTYAHAGDAVLLSPACASFDMFQNFEHRGEVFNQLVRSLS